MVTMVKSSTKRCLRSWSVLAIGPFSRCSLPKRASLRPFAMPLLILIMDQRPPTIIVPTPMYLIWVLHTS